MARQCSLFLPVMCMTGKEKDMKKNKTKDMTFQEASDFWDEHDFFEFTYTFDPNEGPSSPRKNALF